MQRIERRAKAVNGEDDEGSSGKVKRIAFANSVILAASPARVWSVLTDFPGHRHWKPFIQLAGAAVEGGEATYSVRIAKLGKTLSATADIVRLDEPVAFVWATGVEKLLVFEEAYELSRDPIGTRLRHSINFSGILAGMWTLLLRRRLLASLVTSDRCLERHLRRLTTQARGRTPPTDGIGRNRRKS